MEPVSQPSEQKDASSLLDLPPELRLQIYKHLMVHNNVICVPHAVEMFRNYERRKQAHHRSTPAKKAWKYSSETDLSAQFLRTNKLIHNEASAVLYGGNRFDIEGWKLEPDTYLTQFLRKIGTDNAERIKHVRISMPVLSSANQMLYGMEETERDIAILERLRTCRMIQTITMIPRPDPFRNFVSDEMRVEACSKLDWIEVSLKNLTKCLRAASITIKVDITATGGLDYFHTSDRDIQESMKGRGWKLV